MRSPCRFAPREDVRRVFQHSPYCWGDPKRVSYDSNWKRSDVIHRWIRSSDSKVAYIGIPKNRTLSKRISSYINGGSKYVGLVNRKVFNEHNRLAKACDCLCLEITDQVPGYNLALLRDRLLAEALLIGYYQPYLQYS
jgi:hypothetical protein